MSSFIDTLDTNLFRHIQDFDWTTLTSSVGSKSILIRHRNNPLDVNYIYWQPEEQRVILMSNYLYYTTPITSFNLIDIFAGLNINKEQLCIDNIQRINFHNLLDTHIKDIDWQYAFTVYPVNELTPPIPEPRGSSPPRIRNYGRT